jgi:hypothetical protein
MRGKRIGPSKLAYMTRILSLRALMSIFSSADLNDASSSSGMIILECEDDVVVYGRRTCRYELP